MEHQEYQATQLFVLIAEVSGSKWKPKTKLTVAVHEREPGFNLYVVSSDGLWNMPRMIELRGMDCARLLQQFLLENEGLTPIDGAYLSLETGQRDEERQFHVLGLEDVLRGSTRPPLKVVPS